MIRHFLWIFLAALLLSYIPAEAREHKSSQALIAAGDAAYARFDNRAALESYQSALQQDPLSYEAAWKLSRAYVDVGENLDDKGERRAHYEKAHEMAEKAVEIEPGGAKGHLWLSIALGRVALDAGGKEKVKLSKEIKMEVDRALAIDPMEDVAWHVLGLWHRNVATLSWIERKFADIFLGGVPKEATLEEAVRCLKRAREINGQHVNHHLELAITYEMIGERDLAAEGYRKVLALPVSDGDDPKHKKEAEARLKGLEG
jgi:tetratricopeptide (TPR) repeat protein